MLVLRDVSRSLGKDQILSRISLDFSSDRPTALLGFGPPAREAFLRLLEGADKPKTGALRLDGKDILHARRKQGRIIRVGPNGEKPSGQRVGRLIGEAAAERAGLAGRMEARVAELNLEERVRLAVAAAVQRRPGLILLDSPASELEAEARARFVADLPRMVGGSGAVVVLTGAADEAVGLAGRVVIVEGGRVVQVGAAADVAAAPANLAAAAAVAAPALNAVAMTAREWAGVLPDGSVFQPPEGIVLPETGACTLAFRPDDMAPERRDAGCVRFVVRAADGVAEGIAGRRYARVTFAGATWLMPAPMVAAAPGMTLNVFVDRARLMVFDAEGKAVR